MRALVADDDPIARWMLRTALVRLGVDVVEAADGDAAWKILDSSDAPRLALLDWHMPGSDGPDLCRRLRARGTQPYVYAALVTTRGDVGDVVEGFEAGADDFIVKPFDMAELAARVQAARRLVELHSDLEQSRSYLAAVIEHLDHGAMLAGSDSRIVCANPALARVFGAAPSAMIGADRREYLRASAHRFADPDAFLRAVEAESEGPHTAEFEVSRPERRIIRWMNLPVALAEGSGQLDLYQDVTGETDRQRAEEHLARTDPLTGLANRRGFAEAAEREVSRASRTGAPLSVVLFDIDRFKRINDEHGHQAGDRVLQHVARCLAETARCTDVVARWGGEEFIALLPDTDAGGARTFAERIRAAVAELSGDIPHVTVSAGIARRSGSEVLDESIARADARLYEAKASGRDTIRS